MESEGGSRLGNVLIGATAVLVLLYIVSILVDSAAATYGDTQWADEIAMLQSLTSSSFHVYVVLAALVVIAVGVYRWRRERRSGE
ncbi:hypothetical protein VB773_04600 [Haloarculaceae archaeon H-GB2-1]|nr:hypothetical protein [Haloarculaceae archaeon H-GB1-1]MEA5388879.1 hypothetical protein [Haloarculaceae archaeon H-GB11]MEA5406931.1 hypothetical protein [Haloarculaceae archaeon H-GB2-1]